LDAVDDTLLGVVQPPGSSRKSLTPFRVMDTLEKMFGQANMGTHSMLRAALFSLRQEAGEGIRPYFMRAWALHDSLVRAGGTMSATDFLQCLGEGLLEQFYPVLMMLRNGPRRKYTAATLQGNLLEEEARLLRKASLTSQGALQTLSHGITAAVTGLQPWASGSRPAARGTTMAPPPPASGSTPWRGRPSTPADLCWNCGKNGHVIRECPQPLVKPFPFQPADYVPRGQRRGNPGRSHAAAPAGAASAGGAVPQPHVNA
jgi:hypothetical protein